MINPQVYKVFEQDTDSDGDLRKVAFEYQWILDDLDKSEYKLWQERNQKFVTVNVAKKYTTTPVQWEHVEGDLWRKVSDVTRTVLPHVPSHQIARLTLVSVEETDTHWVETWRDCDDEVVTYGQFSTYALGWIVEHEHKIQIQDRSGYQSIDPIKELIFFTD